LQRPDSVFARGTAAKVPLSDQEARFIVTGLIQDEVWVGLSVRPKTPAVEKELTEAGAFYTF
jgi:hypothetical protein